MSSSQAALVFVVMAPGAVFFLLALTWLVGWVPSERVLSRITGLTFTACLLALLQLLWTLASTGDSAIVVTFGNWFAVHEYRFPLVLMADRLSLPFLAMTVVLSGLIGQFSATYLHRESGFFRFFLLLHLFAFGSLLAFAAGSFDLLIGGWELVGITSVLLIAFFDQRPAPVENSLRVFAVYRACDIGLLVGVFAMHNWAGNASVRGWHASAHGSAGDGRVSLSSAGRRREGRADSVLGMASARHGGSDAVERHLLRRHLDSRGRIPSAPRATPARRNPRSASICVIAIGARDGHLRHYCGPRQRRCQDLARVRVAHAGRRGLRRDWIRLEIDRGGPHSRDTPWSGRCSSSARRRCFTTITACTPPSAARSHRRAGIWKTCSRKLRELWLYRWALDRGHLDTILDRWFIHPLLQLSRLFATAGRNRNELRGQASGRAGDFDAQPRRTGSRMMADLHGFPARQRSTASRSALPGWQQSVLMAWRRHARIVGFTASLVSVAASVLLLLAAPAGRIAARGVDGAVFLPHAGVDADAAEARLRRSDRSAGILFILGATLLAYSTDNLVGVSCGMDSLHGSVPSAVVVSGALVAPCNWRFCCRASLWLSR